MFRTPFEIMENDKNKQSNVRTRMKNEVTSNSEGQKKLDLSLEKLRPRLSELIDD